MVLVPPGQEMPNLSGVAGLGLLAAGAAALGQKPLDQQGVAPHNSAGRGVIKQSADKSQRSSLVQALKAAGSLATLLATPRFWGRGVMP